MRDSSVVVTISSEPRVDGALLVIVWCRVVYVSVRIGTWLSEVSLFSIQIMVSYTLGTYAIHHC